jgi:SNF2 family DNA or RNA helicase
MDDESSKKTKTFRQATISSLTGALCRGSSSSDEEKKTPSSSVNLRIPILPADGPLARQPCGLKLPLRSHQLRALSRCLTIEDPSSGLQKDFGAFYHFQSRGGVLADRVGTGKTAVILGLLLHDATVEQDTLIVTPSHLVKQWKLEIQKFSDQIEVIVGKEEYQNKCHTPSTTKRRVVLIDVDTVLKGPKLWYDWRQCYTRDGENILTKVNLDAQTLKK